MSVGTFTSTPTTRWTRAGPQVASSGSSGSSAGPRGCYRRAMSWRGLTLLGATIGLAAGCSRDPPGAPASGTGDGDGGNTTTAGDNDTTESASAGSSSGAPGEARCVGSDAPAPFCHREFPFQPLDTTDVAGIHADVIDGIRPVLLIDNDADQWAVVDPRNVGATFVQGIIPTELQPRTVAFATADLTRDGVADFVFYSIGLDDGMLVVVDGVTLEEAGVLQADTETVFERSIGFMDVDGDGHLEVLTADDRLLDTSLVEAWSLADGSFSKRLSFDTEIDYPGAGWPRLLTADVTGDSIVDFSNVWPIGSEHHFSDAEPTITTLVGPPQSGEQPVTVRSSQPFFAWQVDVADMDGDGDAELLMAENVSEIHILDWSGSQLVDAQILGLPEGHRDGAVSKLLAGRLTLDGLGGVFVGGIPGLHNSMGAIFVSGAEPRFAEQDARLVADFNDDGIEDFWTRDGLMYLSNPAAR